MTIIVTAGQSGDQKIGYNNLLESTSATISASSETTGYEKENLFDWRLDDWWKPTGTSTEWVKASFVSAQTADYFAFFGTDLYSSSGSIKLQYSTNGGSSWSDATTWQSPSTNRVYFVTFDQISAADWRVFVDGNGSSPAIGMAAFGDSLTLPHGAQFGFSPARYNRRNEILNATASAGAFIGRSLYRRGAETSIELRTVSESWMDANWLDFIVHAEKKPFFFSWDASNHSDEAAYCWTDDITPPSHTDALYMEAGLKLSALYELDQ